MHVVWNALALIFHLGFSWSQQPLRCYNALATVDGNFGDLNRDVNSGVSSVDCALLDRRYSLRNT
jgi:hypothetical protein